MGVPDVEVLVKHKYREDLAHAPVKVREILRHGGHPFRLANRKMSRCLSLIWKFAESLPSSVEVVSMGNLKSFVHKLRGEGAAPGLWGELDVVEMNLNIPRPLPIGGSASAQYPSTVLMYLERNVSWSTFPPRMRYRDNYLFYLRVSDPALLRDPGEYLAGVSERLQDAVGLPIQVDGLGESLDFLESTLCFTDGLPDIGLKVPLAFAPRGSPTPPKFVKMVDGHSPNAPRVLQSFIPNIFRKASWYRFDDLRFVINIGHMIRLLCTKGYPSARWRPTMFAKAAALDMSYLMHVASALGADE
jgi:hypothetical protein